MATTITTPNASSLNYEITTKIARIRIGSDLYQSGDGILMDNITVKLGENKSSSTCSFTLYDPGLKIAAKYRAISIQAGGIIVDPQLLGKGITDQQAPASVPNTTFSGSTPTQSNQTTGTQAQYAQSSGTGTGVYYRNGYSARMLAFMDVIAYGEVNNKLGLAGYCEGNTGQPFTDTTSILTYSGFPPMSAGTYVGRYQFGHTQYGEWQATNPGLSGFSPQVQDTMAVWRIGWRGATSQVESGDLTGALNILCKEWASLPNPATGHSYYKLSGTGRWQPSQTMAHVQSYYQERLAYYESQPGLKQLTKPPVEKQMTPTQPSNDAKKLAQQNFPTETAQKGTEIIIEMMVGTSQFSELIAFHFIHTDTNSAKEYGKETTTFSGKSIRWHLSRVPQTQTMTGVTLRDFATKVAKEYNLTLTMEGDGLTYHYLPQEGQSHLQLLERECTAMGFRFADHPRTNELIIEPWCRPKFTYFVIDENTLISAKFSDKAVGSPRYIPGAHDSATEQKSAGNKVAVDRKSGTLNQSKTENKVGTTSGGITGKAAPPAAGVIKSVFGVSLNALSNSQAAAAATTAAPPPTQVTETPVVTSKTVTKPDGSVITVNNNFQRTKQFLQITEVDTTTTTTVKGSATSTVTNVVTNVYTDKGTTTTTAITTNGTTTTTTQTSTKVNNAVLATKSIAQSSALTSQFSGSGIDDGTGLPKQTPGAIALADGTNVEAQTLIDENSRIKGYEGHLTLRTTKDVLLLLPGEIIALSGRIFPQEFATEVRIDDIVHNFASGKSDIGFYTPLANENNSVPASVPNTTFSPLKTTAIATPPTSGRSGYLIPPASASSGDGVGFIVSRGRIHKGVDVRCPYGTPIVAPGDGVVVQIITGYGGGYGNHVWMSLIAPQINQTVFILVAHGADGSIRVSPGQKVSQGQTLMSCGATGHSFGPHLHFECHIGSQSAPPSPPSAVGITVPQPTSSRPYGKY